MNESTTERFINEVREYEVLYDKKNKDYTKVNIKNKIWCQIGENFSMQGIII